MARPAPRSIGPYELVRELGRGGMGAVHEGVDRATGRRVALKVVLPSVVDADALARFEREAQLLARVKHPGVVRVHALERAGRAPVLVTELIEGARPLEPGPLPPEEAARVVRDLADAVEAVHQAGVLHRDLKPGNVLRRADGSLVLLDFGLARELDGSSLTRTGEVIGTPAFMAPEQVTGGRGLDARVDVYGLGALLYALLVGAPPFAGGLVQVLAAVLDRDPAWPAARVGTPPALDRIVRRAMAKAPAGRQPSAAALRDELDAWLAAPPEPSGRAARLGALAAAAALLVGLGLALPTSTPAPAPAPAPARSVDELPAPSPGVARAPDARKELEELADEARRGALSPSVREAPWVQAPVPPRCRASEEEAAVRANFLDARRIAVTSVAAPRAAVATITATAAGRAIVWTELPAIPELGPLRRVLGTPRRIVVCGRDGIALVDLAAPERTPRVVARVGALDAVIAGSRLLFDDGGGASYLDLDADPIGPPRRVMDAAWAGASREVELALSPDGRLALVLSTRDDLPGGSSELEARRLPEATNGPIEPVELVLPAGLTRKSVVFTPDGALVLGGNALSLELWQLGAPHAEALAVPGDRYELPALIRVGVSPRGRVVYAATGSTRSPHLNEMVAWAPGGALARRTPHPVKLRSLSVSPDGLFLAVGTDDGQLEVWVAGDDVP